MDWNVTGTFYILQSAMWTVSHIQTQRETKIAYLRRQRFENFEIN
jgi:hypothetical protein